MGTVRAGTANTKVVPMRVPSLWPRGLLLSVRSLLPLTGGPRGILLRFLATMILLPGTKTRILIITVACTMSIFRCPLPRNSGVRFAAATRLTDTVISSSAGTSLPSSIIN